MQRKIVNVKYFLNRTCS